MPVYFAQAGENGLVKIGYAKIVKARLAVIQIHCAADLILLREMAGDRKVETWFHQQFKRLRVRNEWFIFDPTMLTLEPPHWITSGDREAYYLATHKRARAQLARVAAHGNSGAP